MVRQASLTAYVSLIFILISSNLLNIFYLKCFWLDISSLDHFNFQMVDMRFYV